MSEAVAGKADSRRIETFEDLIAWQKARALVKEIMSLSEQPPIAHRFGFRDQIQRAAISTMSNIVEGFERGSRAEFFHFLSIAKGCCAEVRSLTYVGLDAGYIAPERFQLLNAQTAEVSRLIGGLRASVGRQRDSDRQRT